MSNIKVKKPQACKVLVVGGVGCGKSIIIDRIEKMIKKEFSALVVSQSLESERKMNDLENLSDWQKDQIKDTVWIIEEMVSK